MEQETAPQTSVNSSLSTPNSTAGIGELLSYGANLFTKNWLNLCLCVLVVGVILAVGSVLYMIPILGQIIYFMIVGFLVVRLTTVFLKTADGESAEISLLFSDMSQWLQSGLTYVAAMIFVSMPIAIVALIAGAASFILSTTLLALIFLPLGLLATVITLVISMLVFSWPLFYADGRYSGWDSIWASVSFNKSHVITAAVLGLISFVITLLAAPLIITLIPAGAYIGCVLVGFYRQHNPKAQVSSVSSEAISASTRKLLKFDIIGGIAIALFFGIGAFGGGMKLFSGLKSSTSEEQESKPSIFSSLLNSEASETSTQKSAEKALTSIINSRLNDAKADVEISSINSQNGQITIKNKATGESVEIDPQKIAETSAALLKQMEAAGIKAPEAKPEVAPAAEEKTESIPEPETPKTEITSLPESTTPAPRWIGLPDQVKLSGHMQTKSDDSMNGMAIISSSLAPEELVNQLKPALEKAGLTVEVSTIELEGSTSIIKGANDSGKEVNVVITKSDNGGSQGQLQYSETKIQN